MPLLILLFIILAICYLNSLTFRKRLYTNRSKIQGSITRYKIKIIHAIDHLIKKF